MATIDERVVSMKFNNGQFQKAVQATLDGLSSLKAGLNFSGVKSNFADLGAAAKSVNMQGLADGVDNAASRFDNLKVVGLAALATLTAKAASAGIEMAKSLANKAFLQAPKEGLAEYETKIGSIQTILANTSKHGTKLQDVNKALDQLNTYADRTIYNFGDMTKNIGFFTNAGIGIEDATSMIKGFSNEAASSGTTAAAAAGAAYQLSQALSSGKVTLMDWKSLTNVGMGSANMKDGIIQIAEAMGTLSDKGVTAGEIQKDFNSTLEKGWLTADVMQSYLQIQAGDLSKAQMKSIGLTDKQIDAFVKQSKVAQDAATKVRTLSQLLGTYAEAVGSGWAKSWEIVFGDFEEATTLFTGISKHLDTFASASSDARNNFLQSWKDMGGRTSLINGLMNLLEAFSSIVTVVKEAWADVFPPQGAGGLVAITKAFENFTKLLIIGDGQASALGATLKFLFNILKVGGQIVGGVFIVLGKLLSAIFTGGKGVDQMSKAVEGFFNGLNDKLANTQWITDFFTMLGDLIAAPIPYLQQFAGAIADAFGNLGVVQGFGDAMGFIFDSIVNIGTAVGKGLGWILYGGLETVFTRVIERVKSLASFGDAIKSVFAGIGRIFKDLYTQLKPVLDVLAQMGEDIGKNISDVFTNVNFDTGLDILNTGLLAGLVLLIRNFFKNVLGMGDGVKDDLLGKVDDLVGGLKDIMGGLTDTLSAMQTSIKADTILKIAGAIAILTASVLVLSLIDSDKLTAALVAMSTMFVQLGVSMKILSASMLTVSLPSMVGLGIALMLLATSILILSFAVKSLSELSWGELIKGLTGTLALLVGMSKAAQIMGRNAANLIATGIGLMAVAVAIKILASAVEDFAEMDFGQMVKGLVGVGTVLTGLALFTKFAKVNKGAIGSAAGLILLGVAVKILASAVGDFADMDTGALTQGLISLTLVLAALAAFSKGVGSVGNMVSVGAGLILLGAALKIITSALSDLGSMDTGAMIQGLIGMSVALGAIALALNLMPASTLASAASLVIVSAALVILAGALRIMGSMDLAAIGKALLVLVVSLAAIAGAMLLMTAALPGAAALLIVAAALTVLVPVLVLLGNLPFETILIGLGALAAIFLVLGVAGLLMAPITPIILALGIAIGVLGLGVMGIGAGMALFAAGLATLAAVGSVAIPVLVELIKSLADMIPYLAQKIGEGIVAIAVLIGENAPVLVDALKQLVLAILVMVQELIPVIMDTVQIIVDELLNLLLNSIPKMVDMGMRLIIGILDGIGNNIGQLVTAGINVVVNFLNGVASNIGNVVNAAVNLIVAFLNGIASNIGRVAAAGTNVIIALIRAIASNANRLAEEGANAIIQFVNGLADTVERKSGEMRAAGNRLAMAIADGMSGGLASRVSELGAKAANMANSVIGRAKEALGINSPSKVFTEIGEFTGDGLDIGMSNRIGAVKRSAEVLGNGAIAGVKTAMGKVKSVIESDIDASPTIKPVLDLTDLQNKAGGIGSMFSDPSIKMGEVSTNKASFLMDSMRKSENSKAPTDVSKSEAPAYSFTQNNYSPKAISTVDTYRQTKNLISVVKG